MRRIAGRIRRSPVAVFLILGYSALVVTWALSNPPFASPDEPWHYMRAIAMGQGHPLGRASSYEAPGLTPLQRDWVEQAARAHVIPTNLVPDGLTCQAGHPEMPAACPRPSSAAPETDSVRVIPNGTYQPVGYLAPAALARLGNGPESADLLGRLGAAAVSLMFLAGGIALVVRDEPADDVGFLGVLVALTPMALFMAATLSPSGLEIASAIAFVSTLLVLAERQRFSPGLLAAFLPSCLALALSRSTAPLWVVIHLGLFMSLNGLRRGLDAFWQDRLGRIAAGGVAVSLLLNRVWEHLYGPKVVLRIDSVRDVTDGIGQIPSFIYQQIGSFGWLDTPMPGINYYLWRSFLWIIVLLALLAGSKLERRTLVIAVLASLSIPVLLHAALLVHTGFYVQGRHVLPLSVAIPLYSAEIIRRRFGRFGSLWPAGIGRLLAWAVALVQFLAWYANARRSAVGSQGPIFFVRDPAWSPLWGWWPWIVLALMGSAFLGLAGEKIGPKRGIAGPEFRDAVPTPVA